MRALLNNSFWLLLSRGMVVIAQCWLITVAGATQVGGAAPNFTLKSSSGKNLRLSEYRGEVVMINFWATWCGPCRQEMPVLDELYRQYRKVGFTLLGVNIDDQAAGAKKFAQRLKIGYPILFDNAKAVSRLYDIDAMPTTVLVDRDGKVRYLHRGYLPGFEKKYEQQIRGLLRE